VKREEIMKLEHTFVGMLNSSNKGLCYLLERMQKTYKSIKKATDENDLKALKVLLIEGQEISQTLERFFAQAIKKASSLTVNESKEIIDLSIAPEKRN
jgi:ATP-dependent Clp protease ATP-binding subunit ClpA